jgi:hypothetical protein
MRYRRAFAENDELVAALKMAGSTSGEMMFNAGVDACAAGKQVTIDALVAALGRVQFCCSLDTVTAYQVDAALALARGGR